MGNNQIKKLTFREFKHIYSRVPRLCVEIIIKTNKGVLLTKRSVDPLRGQWHIPGGTILMGETIERALKRVSQEELNLRIDTKKMLGVIEYNIKNYFSRPIGLAFLAKITSPYNIQLDKQADDVKFFKVIPRNTVKEHKLFLNDLMNKKML
jgi:ADP-ribose pyrophosphatase YjhB (NUDIX family)